MVSDLQSGPPWLHCSLARRLKKLALWLAGVQPVPQFACVKAQGAQGRATYLICFASDGQKFLSQVFFRFCFVYLCANYFLSPKQAEFIHDLLEPPACFTARLKPQKWQLPAKGIPHSLAYAVYNAISATDCQNNQLNGMQCMIECLPSQSNLYILSCTHNVHAHQ